MTLALAILGVVAVVALMLALWIKTKRERRHLERHSITPEELHSLLHGGEEVLLFDVRQPLDFLTDAELIPGARRVPPKEIEEHARLIPKDRDLVVYCTCPSEATARRISQRAQEMKFTRVRFLQGGLGGWKQRGYAVESFQESFHLDTAT